METIKDHFLDLERHRRQLEENVETLRKALTHWHVCDTEYEELKEEIEAIAEPLDRSDLDRICDEFEGQVVTEKEVKEIFGEPKPKPKAQIINILSRRIDYVSKNVETLEKQLDVAEQKYEKASIVVDPDVRDEDTGLPITDIIEELGEDDQVTSYRLQRPGDMQPQLREALEKAGIKEKDLFETNQKPATESAGGAEAEQRRVIEVGDEEPEEQPAPVKPEEGKEKKSERPQPKKGVSFSGDTKPGDDPDANGNQPLTRTAERLEQIMQQAKEQANPISDPVIPEDEDEYDAELRREMLRYSMTDIAPIVAELEVDEGSQSEYSEMEFSDEEGEEEDDEDDEDEDEHGRYKGRAVDDKYRRRMQELEAKLGIKSTREIEEAEAEANGRIPDEGIARIAVQPAPVAKSALKSDPDLVQEDRPRKKGVKFANAVDVASAATNAPSVSAVEEIKQPFVDPMKGTIVERNSAPPPAAAAAAAPTEPKKTSRFKKARTPTTATPVDTSPATQTLPSRPKGPSDAPARFLEGVLEGEVRTAPSGPEGKTLAGTIVERDTPAGGAAEPDEFNAALLHQEAAVEYHRVRNRMIQMQGGFVREEVAAIEYPDDEDEGGKPVSRFKAARMARQSR